MQKITNLVHKYNFNNSSRWMNVSQEIQLLSEIEIQGSRPISTTGLLLPCEVDQLNILFSLWQIFSEIDFYINSEIRLHNTFIKHLWDVY